MIELKSGIEIIENNGLFYKAGNNGRLIKYTPWLADSLSFVYDFSMNKSVFPKKFGALLDRHYEILSCQLESVHGMSILELGTGSGSAVNFLAHDNRYVGIDISSALLKQAEKRFHNEGFLEPEFYVTAADDLPFDDKLFDVCLCVLSLNFFNNARAVLHEVYRILKLDGMFLCCVPVPEKNRLQSTIHGTLYSEKALAQMCQETGLKYKTVDVENGALLYFRADKKDE